MSISVLILTLNEERNLPRCIESVQWSDDIVVLDSGSTDSTVLLAESSGARVVFHPFADERSQREFALRNINFRHPWVYNPDADEVTPRELRDEILAAVADSGDNVAYRVRFRNMFMGKWLRWSSLYPTWVVRLFRPERISFRREVNLTYLIDGPQGQLKQHFLHYSFNKGFRSWFEKHARYAEGEARETIVCMKAGSIVVSDLFTFDVVKRRAALKQLSFRLPFRPLFRFVYMFVFRLGILDGIAGLTYCTLLSIYEYMIVLNIREQRTRAAQRQL